MVQLRTLPVVAALAVFAAPVLAAELSAGQVLVATASSRDPDFRESVVLLIHYDRRGAIGLMLNRPTKIDVRDLLPQAAVATQRAWAGGPVPLGITALLRARKPPPRATPLFGDVALVTDRRLIGKLAQTSAESSIRIYAGNCGWTMEQLNDEIRRGLWTVRAADAGIVFNTDPEKLWSRLTRR